MLTNNQIPTYTEDRFVPIEDQSGIATIDRKDCEEAWNICLNELIRAIETTQEKEGEPSQLALRLACDQLLGNKKLNPRMPPIFVGREPCGGVIMEYEIFEDGIHQVIEYTYFNDGTQDYTVYENNEIVDFVRTPIEQ